MAEKAKAQDAGTVTPPVGATATQAPVETVSIPRAEWEKVMGMMGKVNEMENTIMVLRGAADRHKVQLIEEKMKTPGNSIVKLRTFRKDGEQKIVVGYTMGKNDVYQDPISKREVSNQTMIVVLDDNTSVELPYTDFTRFTEEKLLAEVVGKSEDKQTYRVKLLGSDKPEMSINAKYLN